MVIKNYGIVFVSSIYTKKIEDMEFWVVVLVGEKIGKLKRYLPKEKYPEESLPQIGAMYSLKEVIEQI